MQICAAYSDLDYYKIPQWHGCDPVTVAHAALNTLETRNIPLPTLILFSGRGLLLLWLHNPLSVAVLPVWAIVQKRIHAVLMPFGADQLAMDVARVFRIIGSTHSKTGESVRLIWSLLPVDSLVRWPFDTLVDRIMPLTRQEYDDRRIQRVKELEQRRRVQRPDNPELVAPDGKRAEKRAARWCVSEKQWRAAEQAASLRRALFVFGGPAIAPGSVVRL